MGTYIGPKIVVAEPMNEQTFSLTVRPLPPIEDQQQRQGREGYKVVYEDGYVSWSPKDVFERCYRRITDAEKALLD